MKHVTLILENMYLLHRIGGREFNMNNTKQCSPDKATTGKCILIVENDSTIAANLYEAISKETNHHVFVASNGFAALKFVRHIIPQLLILGRQVPDMDGINLYVQLHSRKELRDVPTFILDSPISQIESDNPRLIKMNEPLAPDKFLEVIEELITFHASLSGVCREKMLQ